MNEEEVQLFSSLRYDRLLEEVPQKRLQNAGWNYEHVSPFYMLDYQRDRFLRAATYWAWQPAIDKISGDKGLQRLKQYAEFVTAGLGPEPHRLKVTLSKDGVFGHEKGPVPRKPLANLFPTQLPPPGSVETEDGMEFTPAYEVILDLTRTQASEYTHYKTTKRQMYSEARERAGIFSASALQEVLIINDEDGSVMEGSTTTVYFWRGGRWVTPPVSPAYGKDGGSGGHDGTSRRWTLTRLLAVEEVVKFDSIADGEECWMSNAVRGFMFGKIKIRQLAN